MGKSSVITDEFKAIQTALEVLEPLNEAQRNFAVTMILTRLGITAASLSVNTGGGGGGGSGDGGGGGGGGGGSQGDIKKLTPKDFLRSKRTTTDLERFICLAFYLANVRDVQHFKTRDITALNTEAAGAKFSNAATTANNAVNQSGFLSHAGGGKKPLTTLGEDVVKALPDREAVGQAIAAAPKKRKPKGKGKSKGRPKAKA